MNHYGPTEATVGCCTYELSTPAAPRPASATVPIGRPITDATRLRARRARGAGAGRRAGRAVHRRRRGGPRATSGAPEQTAERFVPDPFAEPGACMYRTGDLARRLAGRRARVPRPGRRAGEDPRLPGRAGRGPGRTAAPARRCARPPSWPPARGRRKRLARLRRREPGRRALTRCRALAATLPAYMVPSSDRGCSTELPLTPNGKLDRAALPRAEARGAGRGVRRVRPSPAQRARRRRWPPSGPSSSAARSRRTTTSSTLGGHSLLAIRLIARIRKELGAKLALKALIEAPTVRELAARIDGRRPRPGAPTAGPARPARAGGSGRADAPARAARPAAALLVRPGAALAGRSAHPGQRRLQLLLADAHRGRARHAPRWARAVAEVVRRHEALRTRFAAARRPAAAGGRADRPGGARGGRPAATSAIPRRPPSGCVDEHTGAAVRPGPRPAAARVLVARSGAERPHRSQIVVHHIVFDGVSKVVLYRELGELYGAFAAGQPSPLAPPRRCSTPTTPSGSGVARPCAAGGGARRTGASGWPGMPAALELPTDRRARRWPACAAARLRRAAARPSCAARWSSWPAAQRATFFTAMLAAFDVLLLPLHAGRSDVVVGTPVDTRSRPELEAVIGPFINTVVHPQRPVRLPELPRAARPRAGSARSRRSSTRSCRSSGWSRRWRPSATSAAIRSSRR